MSNLNIAILKTIAFFDVFNYPLTATEIWKWLYKPNKAYSLIEIKEALAHSQFLHGKLSAIEGFYCLRDRESTCYLRKKNNNLAERKFRKARRLVKLFRYIPYVRMVAICNSLAYSNARDDSDIDFFIITKHGKIWLARFFTVLIVKILRAQPQPDENKDTFCLSFFVDESNLNIQNIKLKNDIYYTYWLQQILPIYDSDNLYSKFIKANKINLEFLPNSYSNTFSKEVKFTKASFIISRIIEFLTSPPIINKFTDDAYRKIQSKIIDKNLKSIINIDTRVVVNDQMLKFHANDRREEYYKAWKERIKDLLNHCSLKY